jgi:hypothetical protein
MEFGDFFAKRKIREEQQTHSDCWFSPSDADTLKINFDGSFKENPKAGGWGFVIRDKEGCVW